MASKKTSLRSVPANYEQYLGPLFFEPHAADLVNRCKGVMIKKGLELACGTGRLTKHLLQLLAPRGTLLATDINPEMLAIARNKIQDDRVQWQVVNAQELPYGDETFDFIVCQFGVMFFPDKQKAYREVFRVLQSGGLFVFLTWDAIEHNAISFQMQEVLQTLIPNDPLKPNQKGPYSYFDKGKINDDLHEAGFQQIEVIPVSLSGTARYIDEVLKGIVGGSPLASYLDEHGVQKEVIRKQLQEVLFSDTYRNEKTYHFPMQALYCKGEKLFRK